MPVFNENKRCLFTLETVLKSTKNKIIVVDDGSEDNTWELLSNKYENNKQMVLMHHVLNLGKGAAVKTGVEKAWETGADAVIIIDADGQHDPRHLKTFEDKLAKYPIVFGYRNLDKNIPLVRRVGNIGASRLIQL
jgi:glycosyltransferase involved in cell wall biosynthesis